MGEIEDFLDMDNKDSLCKIIIKETQTDSDAEKSDEKDERIISSLNKVLVAIFAIVEDNFNTNLNQEVLE